MLPGNEEECSSFPHSGSLVKAATALILGLVVWWSVTSWYGQRLLTDQQRRFHSELIPYGNALTTAVNERVALLKGVEAFVRANPAMGDLRTRFDTFAAGLCAGKEGIRAIQAFPPQGPVLVYPILGNEAVIGRSLQRLIDDERPEVRADVRQAITSRRITLSGPYELRQGGLGLVARQAIHHGDELWGMAVIVFDLPPILRLVGLDPLPHSLDVGLRDEKGRVFAGNSSVFSADPVVYEARLPDRTWQLAAIPRGGWRPSYGSTLAWFQGTGLLVVLLLAGLVYGLSDQRIRLRHLVAVRTEALRQSEERHRITLMSVGDGVIATGREGRVEIVNPVAETLTGWTIDDARGKPLDEIFRIVNEDTRQPVESPVARVLREGLVVNLANHTMLVARDGTERPIADSGAPIRGEDGSLTGVVLVFRDQTEERAALAAMRAFSARHEALLSAIPDIIMEVDTNKVYTWANQAGVEFFGKDVIGREAAQYFMGEQDTYRTVEPLFRGDENLVHLESWQRRQDGKARLLAWRCRLLKDPSGKVVGVLSSARDITEQRAMEQEHTRLEAQLRQQQKLEAIGTLAGGVAHEINNPLTGIMNYAQLIGDTAAPGSQAGEYAQEIVHETDRVATIVRNLLQFARHEKQAHSPARIADIVEQTLSLFRAVLRRDQIALTVDVPADLPSIKCRSQQIQQVLMNLLTNARDALNEKYPDYHADKTIAITVREVGSICHLRLPFCDLPSPGTAVPQSQIANPKSQMAEPEARQRWIRITVADHGGGIPVDIRDRIFDPFFTTKPRDQGTGLGLAISHGIVKEHHGRLHFETDPGVGTRFHLDLPVDNGWTMGGEEQ